MSDDSIPILASLCPYETLLYDRSPNFRGCLRKVYDESTLRLTR